MVAIIRNGERMAGRWTGAGAALPRRYLLSVAVNALLGAALATSIAYGPLTASWRMSLAAGLVGFVVGGGLWLWRARLAVSGRRASAQRLRIALLVGHGLFAVGAAMTVLVQLYMLGVLPPLTNDPLAGYDRLVGALRATYPYAQEKGIDLAALTARYRREVAALPADASVWSADTEATYWRLIDGMLGELGDAHTGLMAPSLSAPHRMAILREVEGRLAIERAGTRARSLGLLPGAVIDRIDGQPTEAILRDLDTASAVGSTDWQRRARAVLALLDVTPERPRVAVTFRGIDGVRRQVTIMPPDEATAMSQTDPDVVTWEWLDSGLGYIAVHSFSRSSGDRIIGEFDAALGALRGAPGLVLDVRTNGGGDSRVADAIAGRLLAEPYAVGAYRFRRGLPRFGWQRELPVVVQPRGEPYTGPVALLIDTWSMSSAESFVAALSDAGRVTTVGRRTAGSSGNPIACRLPLGGVARYSTASFVRANGLPVEGIGLLPDVPVELTLSDLRAGVDADVQAAEALLLDKH